MDRVETLTKELKWRARLGLAVCALLVFGIGSWSLMEISSAIIASGRVVVEGNSKKVQHPTGGVIAQLNVKLGDRVKANDVLVRLDETQVRAQLGVIATQIQQGRGRLARLEAERDGATAIKFPTEIGTGPAAKDIRDGEAKLFESRRQALKEQKSQHGERIRQLNEEMKGLSAQLGAKDSELTIQTAEIRRIEGLHRDRLVPETRMSQLKREVVRLDGERGSIVAQIARAKAQISQIDIQILQIDSEAKSEAQKELREVEARIAELNERRIAAEDQLNRVEIRAPIDGLVHELNVFTVGGVVQPGEALMMIVPAADKLVVEARVPPHERSQVAIGLKSVLRYTAFNARTTPEFEGKVIDISADASRDQTTNLTYYTVRVQMDAAESAKASALKIVPGMPVDCFIETERRTALSYFLKPLLDSIHHIFRQQ